jgi:excinuclease ABC subunit C
VSLGAIAQLPNAPGVYRFRDTRDRVVYIGRAADLRRRVGSYWSNLGDRQHLTAMVARIARIEAVRCDSAHEAAWLERNLLERGLPRWNRTPGGQEVPVYIRLDWRPSAPDISVVHSIEAEAREACHFGPYLGGDRVRLAVSGIQRVLPLAYTAERASGFEHEMARARGVGPGDRSALVGAITAVLNRDPRSVAWLRNELVNRRESAAQALDFERAARVQAEIQAVDWVVAEQKVTVTEACDVDVYGWASGVLVHFEVRGGRLCAWRQRPCGEAAALPRVAATPAAWVELAQRNAELAARLVQS